MSSRRRSGSSSRGSSSNPFSDAAKLWLWCSEVNEVGHNIGVVS